MRIKYLMLTLAFALSSTVSAQTFPEKKRPIRIVVPFGVGSGNDLIARAYAQAITEDSGQSVVVENRSGAEGAIGAQAVRNAPADGYTVLFGNSSTHVLNALMLPSIPYDPVKDFLPVAGVSSVSLVLNAGPSTSFKTIKDILDAAKASPGKYTYGSATTSTRLAMDMVGYYGKVNMLHVPYKTMMQAANAVGGGEIDLLVTDVLTAIPHYQAGRMRPIGATGAERLLALPDVPTIKEQGLTSYEFTAWSAMFVPKGTDPGVVDTLARIFAKAQGSKPVIDVLKNNSQRALKADASEIRVLIESETRKWSGIAKAATTKQQ